MTQNEIRIIVQISQYVLIGILCSLLFIFILRLAPKAKNLDLSTKTKGFIDEKVKKRGLMQQMKRELSRKGIMYRAGNYDLNPSWYIIVRCLGGAVVTLILALLLDMNPLSFIGFPVGYLLVGVYYNKMNEADNKAIILDLYNTYASLKIQLQAGIYISDSLIYSCKAATNQRYKEAINELILNISDKTISMDEAIDILRNRFNSPEIDKLCVLLHNYSQYGANDAYAQNIMTQIQAILAAKNMEDEAMLASKAGFVKFGFFVIIIIIVGSGMMQRYKGVNIF